MPPKGPRPNPGAEERQKQREEDDKRRQEQEEKREGKKKAPEDPAAKAREEQEERDRKVAADQASSGSSTGPGTAAGDRLRREATPAGRAANSIIDADAQEHQKFREAEQEREAKKPTENSSANDTDAAAGEQSNTVNRFGIPKETDPDKIAAKKNRRGAQVDSKAQEQETQTEAKKRAKKQNPLRVVNPDKEDQDPQEDDSKPPPVQGVAMNAPDNGKFFWCRMRSE
jgi:hypothetical protein